MLRAQQLLADLHRVEFKGLGLIDLSPKSVEPSEERFSIRYRRMPLTHGSPKDRNRSLEQFFGRASSP